MKDERFIFGKGAANLDLSAEELRQILAGSFSQITVGKRVLAIIPDATRDDLTDVLFPIVAEILEQKGVKKFDALVAQGTHAPMSTAEKLKKIGVDKVKISDIFGQVFDHEWENPQALAKIGEISAEKVGEISGGAFAETVEITINKLVSAAFYDTILIFSSTVPHEVAGFSGGAKYFFPGVAGRELTDATHWLGALCGIPNIIGQISTPTRNLIDEATKFINLPVVCLNAVVSRNSENNLQTHAFFVGDVKTAFLEAAQISAQVHVKYVPQKYRRVVAILDEHYDELWVGGKASYKLGGIIEEGGELLIYAPHLREISLTHGAAIEKFGYQPIEIVREMVKNNADLAKNLCVAAHLAHVAYAGRMENGQILPRFSIKLASALDAEICCKLNFEFADWREIDWEKFAADAETLVVERAGRDLYLIAETRTK
jgi:lactate racemase